MHDTKSRYLQKEVIDNIVTQLYNNIENKIIAEDNNVSLSTVYYYQQKYVSRKKWRYKRSSY